MGLGVIGLEPDGRAVLGDRLRLLALVSEGVPEIVVGHRLIELEADGLTVFRFGRRQLFLVRQDISEVKMQLRMIRLPPQQFSNDGFTLIASVSRAQRFRQGNAEFRADGPRRSVAFNRPVESRRLSAFQVLSHCHQ